MVGDSSSGSLTASEPQQWQDSSKKETLESEVFENANENEANDVDVEEADNSSTRSGLFRRLSSARKRKLETESPPVVIPVTDLEKGIVGWDSQHDPDMPLNFSRSRKWFITILLSAITFMTPFASSILAPSLAALEKDYGVDDVTLGSMPVSIFLLGYAIGPLFLSPLSEIYGRNVVLIAACAWFCIWLVGCALAPTLNTLIFFRFMSGVGGSGCQTIGGGIIGDMFPITERGKAMTIWMLGPVVGPTVAPVIGGFVSETIGWRWVNWLSFIPAAIVVVAMILLNRETNHRVLIERKTKRLQKELSQPELRSCYTDPDAPVLSKRQILTLGLIRPLKMLFRSPNIFGLSLYIAFAYGCLYLLYNTIPTTFEGSYGWTLGITGLVYLTLLVGYGIGLLSFALLSDSTVIRMTAANDGVYEPEMRLPDCIWFALILPTTFFWYGWSADKAVHWIVPIIGIAPFGIGIPTQGIQASATNSSHWHETKHRQNTIQIQTSSPPASPSPKQQPHHRLPNARASPDMRIIKPSWLSHSGEQKDFEVYSCHVSPDGKRIATAGGDGHVRIWSTDAVYHANDGDYKKPRQLCHMSHHLGTIHSVRFSPNGRYLASGADDKLICVYHLDKGPPAPTFGTNEPPPVENWKTYKRLIGHENDVQDLAWSYDSSLLVSVGLDSKVVVWSGHTFEKLKSIPAHQSHVKGITFDPANKFFATASDDRTIKIFRFTPPAPNATQHDMINNFVLDATISSPFKSSPLTTYFRRCSWSPDGNHIAAANAVNGPVSSVAIIERTRWDSEINLIGHEAPTEVCMFSPRLFHTVKPGQNGAANGHGGQLVTVIASAGQDKTLSIWNTNTSRPVVILQDIAGKSISDLAWTPDGQTLFASSLDGSVVVAKFDEGELGWVAQQEENAKALQKYGGSRKGMGIAEDVDGLMLEEHAKAGESRAVQSRMGALMGDFQPESAKESTPASKAESSASVPEKSTANGGADSDKEKEKDKDKETSEKPEEAADKTAERVRELKSRVTVGKDGRKRVAPLLVSSSGTGQSSLPQSQLVGSTTTKNTQNEAPQTILDLSKPFDGLPKGGIVAMLLGNKRRAATTDLDEDEEPAAKRVTGGPTAVVTNGADGVEHAALVPVEHGVIPTPEFLRPAVLNPSISYAQVRLAVPKIRSHILRPLERGVLQPDAASLEDASKLPENIILEAKNDVNPRDPAHVLVTQRGVLIWREFLPRAVILVTASKYFWAVACEDGSLHVWTRAGRRLLNPIILESQPVILECRDYWLMTITAVGLVHVWDLKTQSSPHPPVSVGPILDIATASLNQHSATPGPGITSAHLNSTGHIIVTLTNGDGYFYARDMYTWQRLSEAWWAVGSQYWNSNDSSISALQSTAVGPNSKDDKDKGSQAVTVSSGIIPFLERHTTNEFLLKGRAYALQRIIKMVMQKSEAEGLESSVSIAHLENRIAGALQLGASDEFRLYLFMYAKRLGAEGARGKVEELLNSLLGGVLEEKDSEKADGRGWYSRDEQLCGWDRKELLKGVVLILGKYRELQRLTAQYARLIDLNLDDGSADVDTMDVEA
ncbi:hypothetical protein TsFJ059_006606 [Trichoderma semiorbis]|uniref:Major facilitator superfamily (MFS) profile domain-containing protein n=1 Tax=Trichoderma semiorbis TaxID=1491008 RepID=A0A9P8KKN8_9HYPO|nr:hypothetical protein TsFJ059_006606 [Trichoderma semiorbis]